MALTHGNLCSLRFCRSICILENKQLQSAEGIFSIKGKAGSDTDPAAKQVGFAIYLLQGSMTCEEGLASLHAWPADANAQGEGSPWIPGFGFLKQLNRIKYHIGRNSCGATKTIKKKRSCNDSTGEANQAKDQMLQPQANIFALSAHVPWRSPLKLSTQGLSLP
jgi:hypothetical protein